MAKLTTTVVSLGLASLVSACAGPRQEAPARDAVVAQMAEVAAAKGRAEGDAAAARDLAVGERRGRIEAEVKAVLLEYELAIEQYNHVVTTTLCDAVRGVKDPAAIQKVDAAAARLKPFSDGCKENEPGNTCVERKARETAR